jgi:hypothetical protein
MKPCNPFNPITMKPFLFIILICLSFAGYAQPVELDNPVTVQYLKQNLRKSTPRLVLTPEIERNLKARLKTDPVVKNYYATMKLNAAEIYAKPLLTRHVVGRRLLGTSREMLYRMTILSMIYRIDKDPAALKRIDQELDAVCNFSDWNPSHYLDVAEMSLAVAIAVDWAGNYLPAKTVALAKNSLIEKGIKPSWPENGQTPGWVSGTNNWNQVCNGGMIAASIAVAEKDPELAAKTISRSLDGMPSALKQYAPSGVYPEGATYWDYGTSFSVTTSSLLESAFGTDFGLADYPSFVESAWFRTLAVAPSGWYFNFSDCGDREGKAGDITLAWFAQQTGDTLFLQKEKFLLPPAEQGQLSRLAGPGLVWLSRMNAKTSSALPKAWFGDGPNPIVIFRGGDDDPNGYYFGGKGGKARLSHGNMDAGSFVFELNGVRWSVDPGVQDYNSLEQAGFDLWSSCQDCQRWSLVTKGNFGHSTLTVDEARFKVDASAPVIDFKNGSSPEATIDMSAIFSGHLERATRKFIRDSDHSIVIEDRITALDSTRLITWAMMTTAEVIPRTGGALLKQDGKELQLEIDSPEHIGISVISMDPAPTKYDRQIKDLKRIEIRVPAYTLENRQGTIRIRLSAPE